MYLKPILSIPNNCIVACSSGSDSIAIAHYLHINGFRPTLWHFNHKIRPQNSLMEDSVASFSQYFGIPLVIDTAPPGPKTESECRDARLNAIKARFSDSCILLGHHLDDAVESHCLNFIRGKESYLPMPLKTELENGNVLLRPFILHEKEDLIKYNKKNNLERFVVEDETNKITKSSRRNWIRLSILPLFEEAKIGLSTIVRKKLLKSLAAV